MESVFCIYGIEAIIMSRKKKTIPVLEHLRKCQQSELNAELMYLTLAKRTKVEKDKEIFLKIASQKKRHSEIFRHLTNMDMKPKKRRAFIVAYLYDVFDRKGLYPIIAFLEYRAHFRTDELARKFSSVREVWRDQKLHGDMVAKLVY